MRRVSYTHHTRDALNQLYAYMHDADAYYSVALKQIGIIFYKSLHRIYMGRLKKKCCKSCEKIFIYSRRCSLVVDNTKQREKNTKDSRNVEMNGDFSYILMVKAERVFFNAMP